MSNPDTQSNDMLSACPAPGRRYAANVAPDRGSSSTRARDACQLRRRAPAARAVP
jgi:hypothetical protein